MPSAFAHAAVGASLAAALPNVSGRARVYAGLALAALAAAPDLDVVGLYAGIPYGDPLGHRGLTHSLVVAIGVGLLSFPIWQLVDTPRPGLAALLTTCAIASHGLLDTLTDAGLGVGLLVPFDDRRFFAPFRPLMTSPLTVSAFFTSRGIAILANEVFYVGPIVLVTLLGSLAIRRHFEAHR